MYWAFSISLVVTILSFLSPSQVKAASKYVDVPVSELFSSHMKPFQIWPLTVITSVLLPLQCALSSSLWEFMFAFLTDYGLVIMRWQSVGSSEVYRWLSLTSKWPFICMWDKRRGRLCGLSLSVSSSLSLALCKQTVQCVCCATKACVVRLPWGPTHYILHSVSHHAASFNCQHIQGTKQFLSMPLQMPSGWKICVSMVIVCLMHKIKLCMKKTTHRVLICTLESICRGAK